MTLTMTVSSDTETDVAQATPAAAFERLEQAAPDAGGPGWLMPLRKAAFARFAEQGFPTLRDEDWRFTPLRDLESLPFLPATGPVDVTLPDGLPLAQVPTHRLVFVDGWFHAGLSRLGGIPDGVSLGSLGEFLRTKPDTVQALIEGTGQGQEIPFVNLNTAFFSDGLVLDVPPDTRLELPVHVIHLATGNRAGLVASPRHLVRVGRGGKATVVENFHGLQDAAPYFTNTITEFQVGESANVEHVRIQDEAVHSFHLGGVLVNLQASCRFASHSLALGAALSRVNIRTSLDGPDLECVLNGLYVMRDRQLADHHMVVNHAQPRCESHEYFNGILGDQSRGVFHGRILVQQAAQKTDAKQTNKNLLLSDDAQADTKPQLEIYADDVKCTHGATVGQLDPDAVFYLRARGVGLERARRMLIHAFAGEIIERIQHAPLREELDQLVWERLETKLKLDVPA